MALSVVYPPQGSPVVSAVDIVAVHGLGGDAIDTWTHPRSGAFWLRDFLPRQIPDARILTFGYNAAAAFGNSTSTVVDHAKSLLGSLVDKREDDEEKNRLLIFVVHSLGGIVVKQALLSARLEPRYQTICDATAGIVFFGTPHRGSEQANYANILVKIAQTAMHKPTSPLVKALQTNSQDLQQLTTDFRHQLPQYQVISFYETLPMKPFKSLIVEKPSALLEIGNEEQLPVDANHSMMCKFEKEEDDTYGKAWKRIQRMRKAPQVDVNQDTIPQILSELPVSTFDAFFGRRTELDRLSDLFRQSHAAQKRVVIWSLSGFGKTRLASRYVALNRDQYSHIIWIDMSSKANAEACFDYTVSKLKLEASKVRSDVLVREWLEKVSKWLLVLDSVDNIDDINIREFLPACLQGHVIITSALSNTVKAVDAYGVNLREMDEADAVSLLLHLVPNARIEIVKTIARALHYVPLAIEQASAIINSGLTSSDKFVRLYHDHYKILATECPHTSNWNYDKNRSVFATLELLLSHESLRQNCHGRLLLTLAAFLGSASIIVRLLTASPHMGVRVEEASSIVYSMLQFNLQCLQDDLNLKKSLIVLEELCLIQVQRADDCTIVSFTTHGMVRQWVVESLEQDERAAWSIFAAWVVCKSLAEEDLTKPNLLVGGTLTTLLRNSLHQMVRHLPHAVQGSALTTMLDTSLKRMARHLLLGRAYDDAKQAVELAIAHQRSLQKFHWPEDEASLRLIETLAETSWRSGHLEEAETAFKQLLQASETMLGHDHMLTMRAADGLTRVSQRQLEALQNYASAVSASRMPKQGDSAHRPAMSHASAQIESSRWRAFSRRYSRSEEALELDHSSPLDIIDSLGAQYHKHGKLHEAQQMHTRAMAEEEKPLAPESISTLEIINNLGILYRDEGKLDEAEQMYLRALAGCEKALVPDHSSTLTTVYNLGNLYIDQGKLDEAEQMYQRALAIQEKTLGHEHSSTLATVNKLGILYRARQGRADARTSAGWEGESFRTEPRFNALHHHDLDVSYKDEGKLDEAEQMYLRALAEKEDALEPDHISTLTTVNNLAFIYAHQGRLDEAEQMYLRALTGYEQQLGQEHPRTCTIANNLAKLRSRQKRERWKSQIKNVVLHKKSP